MKYAAIIFMGLAMSVVTEFTESAEGPGAEYEIPQAPTHWLATGNKGGGSGPVTQEKLNASHTAKSSWLHYYGDYRGYRHSAIDNITPQTVGNLEFAWGMAAGTQGPFETSPVVYDGIMYVTTSYNRLIAVNPGSGEVIWRYDYQNPEDLRICCGPNNRGVAIGGDLVVMGTLDAKLLAFHRLTGALVWETVITPYQRGFSVTGAPLIANGRVFIGVGGGEYGIRGFFDAYDLATGERLWRHYTIPTDGEPGVETWAGESYRIGGSPTWNTGTYDPETDTIFWATGNPGPDWNGDDREGDNLYSDSLLAVDPETGELKWYFQFTPHDIWDYDGNTQIILLDVEVNGEMVKVVGHADRNGYYYLINRENGSYILAEPYVAEINWATIDETGRPVVRPGAIPTGTHTDRVCPGHAGGMNAAYTGAYNPNTGLYYVNSIESCEIIEKGMAIFIEGSTYLGGSFQSVDAEAGTGYGDLVAIDASSGEVAWRHREANGLLSGVVSTEGGVLFTGTVDGRFLALDAATGEVSWEKRVGSIVRGQPIVYEYEGDSYVAIATGGSNGVEFFTGGFSSMPDNTYLFVFRLGN
ncbi:MAG: PQQ-dependent dehydrogenase, methanol/ethanol family [Gammaproteobacteria bacterium]|nr:MAG: PQQ-dependent dehydrogenase, methanol/ethanol family [Gammaproteobacteria bacterium]